MSGCRGRPSRPPSVPAVTPPTGTGPGRWHEVAKSRRPRLSWFRFYADDFLGGTGALTAPECGRYLLLLLHQWGTKERQLLPADPERLRVICRGEDPGLSVLSKFVSVEGGLRNQRLADEWAAAVAEYSSKAASGGHHTPTRTPEQIPPRIVGQIGPPTKNQEPRTIERTDGRPAVPANPLIAGRRPDMEREAYRLIREIGVLEPDRDPTEILLEAAKWQGKDGGFRSKVRVETMSDDHLIRTVHDLKSILAEVQGNGTKAAR